MAPTKKLPKKSTKSSAKTAAKKSAKSTAAKKQSASSAVDEQLARYRSMRDFHVTAEPSGSRNDAKKTSNPAALPFCIQKHAASHLHYDFRLGWNGVLKSWAVAKGPSYVVADKRLAVQVEDHPMEYGGFEGIIPKGQYGGGTVMLWDQGTWEPQPAYPDVDAGLKSGSLKFILHGTKLQGKWALIRMHGKSGGSESKPNWLLIKEHDDFERPPTGPSITESEPNSVVTGRTMDQIAASEDHVWNSKDTRSGSQAWYAQPSKSADDPTATGRVPHSYAGVSARTGGMRNARSPTSEVTPSLTSLPRETQPDFLPPQLAQQAETPPSAAGWLHELKLDGYRIQARKSGGSARGKENPVTLLTRKGLDWTHRMKPIADEIARLSAASCTLDGEVVVLRPDGTTSFADLQAAFQEDTPHHLTYFVFDLLHLNGRNTRALPLTQRKALLNDLIATLKSGVIHLSDHLTGDGPAILRNACRMHAEGIVSKRADGAYHSGRSSDWIKCKCLHEQELVIGGFTLPSAGHAGMHGIGALLLGYYQKEKLVYAGRTGTGFSQKTHRFLRDKLDALTQSTSPFSQTLPADQRRGARWVRPELVAQVRFATWTSDNLVRQAAFLGLREDKPAAEVTRETSAPTPKSSRPQNTASVVSRTKPGKESRVAHSSRALRGMSGKENSPRGDKPVTTPLEHPPIRLTHPDKVLDSGSGLTKQSLADYYYAIAPSMLPHIAGRPLSIVRCPDGPARQCFFQKHVNATLPPGIGTVMVADKKTGTPEPYITLSGPSATPTILASLAQLGMLELHPWGSKNSDLEHPDRLIFDLDPDESLPWSAVVAAALELRDRLRKLKLVSFLKTTGGKGLHVVVPITPSPKVDFSAAKEFAHKFVLALERDHPALYLTKMTKAARAGKIYLDYLRNERGATAVAPYSPRARAGVQVSMPLAWSEVAPNGAFATTRPTFSVANFLSWRPRLAQNPWKSFPATH